jgi:hypothetical protein
MVGESCEAEITYFDHVSFANENVGAFDVSMDNGRPPRMQSRHGL